MSITAAEILLDELRHARTSRGMNQDEFGRFISYSGTPVSAVETATRPPTSEYVAAVDKALKTGGIFARLLERLTALDMAPVWLREWITFEEQAKALRATMPDDTIVGHTDYQVRSQTVSSASEIATLQKTWEAVLRDALPRRPSLDLIKEAAKTWT
ncbi:helix-turn-helix domain-containing protein [Micromonospora chokoriensis]